MNKIEKNIQRYIEETRTYRKESKLDMARAREVGKIVEIVRKQEIEKREFEIDREIERIARVGTERVWGGRIMWIVRRTSS